MCIWLFRERLRMKEKMEKEESKRVYDLRKITRRMETG